MAKKYYAVKPPVEIEIEFADGKKLELVFDVKSLFHFNDPEIGGMEALLDNVSQPELCAKIIYAGAKEKSPDLTIEMARAIVTNLDIFTITGIINDFSESIGADKNMVLKDAQKKTMMEFIKAMSTK